MEHTTRLMTMSITIYLWNSYKLFLLYQNAFWKITCFTMEIPLPNSMPYLYQYACIMVTLQFSNSNILLQK